MDNTNHTETQPRQETQMIDLQKILDETKDEPCHHFTSEFVIEFVRQTRGDKVAEEVAADPERLVFWDEKIFDWSTD